MRKCASGHVAVRAVIAVEVLYLLALSGGDRVASAQPQPWPQL